MRYAFPHLFSMSGAPSYRLQTPNYTFLFIFTLFTSFTSPFFNLHISEIIIINRKHLGIKIGLRQNVRHNKLRYRKETPRTRHMVDMISMSGPRVPYSRRMENLRESNFLKTFHLPQIWHAGSQQHLKVPKVDKGDVTHHVGHVA